MHSSELNRLKVAGGLWVDNTTIFWSIFDKKSRRRFYCSVEQFRCLNHNYSIEVFFVESSCVDEKINSKESLMDTFRNKFPKNTAETLRWPFMVNWKSLQHHPLDMSMQIICHQKKWFRARRNIFKLRVQKTSLRVGLNMLLWLESDLIGLSLMSLPKVIGDKFPPSHIIYVLPLGLDIIISGL